jgi:hypothetical protein
MATYTLPANLWTELKVATLLSLPVRTVVRMAKAGQIPCAVLPNGDLVFDPADLAKWLDSLKRPVAGGHDADP